MNPTPPIWPVPEAGQSPLGAIIDSRRQLADGRLSADDIVAILQEAIIRGVYGPGRALRQDDLAQLMGISKIPVREALRTLQASGFVELHHHRGAIVKELTASQLREAFDLREMLEPNLMRAAVDCLTQADLDTLETLVTQMDHETNAWRFSELNTAFHRTLYEPAGRALSMQILSMLQGHIQRMSFMQLSLSGHNCTSNEEHRAILAACRRRDAHDAARLVQQHVGNVKHVVLALHGLLQAGQPATMHTPDRNLP